MVWTKYIPWEKSRFAHWSELQLYDVNDSISLLNLRVLFVLFLDSSVSLFNVLLVRYCRLILWLSFELLYWYKCSTDEVILSWMRSSSLNYYSFVSLFIVCWDFFYAGNFHQVFTNCCMFFSLEMSTSTYQTPSTGHYSKMDYNVLRMFIVIRFFYGLSLRK